MFTLKPKLDESIKFFILFDVCSFEISSIRAGSKDIYVGENQKLEEIEFNESVHALIDL